MATIKSYTDISQSKKLAEILPLESADMYYQYVIPKSDKIKHNPEIGNPINALEWYNKGYTLGGKKPITLDEYCVPCWSLAALLELIPNPTLVLATTDSWKLIWGIGEIDCDGMYEDFGTIYGNTPVDSCVATIEKLHELNLL